MDQPGGAKALTTLADYTVNQDAFFAILERKEQNFHNGEMAEQILKRAFDYSHRKNEKFEDKEDLRGSKKRVLTQKEIKELEKKESITYI